MAGARALPDVVSRFKMDTSGLKKAEAEARAAGGGMATGLGGASKATKAAEKDLQTMEKRMAAAGVESGKFSSILGGGLTPQTLALAAGAAIAFKAGESMVHISEEWENATRSLDQAVETAGGNIKNTRQEVDNFIASNRRFVSNQADVAAGYATLARSGLSAELQTKAMNVALDLSALKHIDLSSAVKIVTMAEQGRGKALAELGIKIKDYPDLTLAATQAHKQLEAATKAVTTAHERFTDAVKKHGASSTEAHKASLAFADAQHKLKDAQNLANAKTKEQADLLDALGAKTKGGRQTTNDLTQAQNQLGNAWQTLARVAGPPLLNFVTLVVSDFADFVSTVSDVVGWIGRLIGRIGDLVRSLGNIHMPSISLPHIPGLQHGGFALPGQVYRVGERGPELLAMGERGGVVIPNAGSPQPAMAPAAPGKVLHQHFYNAHVDPLMAAREAAWVLRK